MKCAAGTEEYSNAAKVGMFLENPGALCKRGTFTGELLFDWLAVDIVWKRIESFGLVLREPTRDPRIYENFEAKT